MNDPDAIDLFAGPGGWDLAARELGLTVLGIENDPATCATREAAGLPTLCADVRKLDPLDYLALGLIASPPCQTFSAAGKGSGRAELADIVGLIRFAPFHPRFTDERTALVLEPLRWIMARAEVRNPYTWIAMEQVPTVLPIWEAYAQVLRSIGYTVSTGRLSAEQYGVPQTRRRAFLVAKLRGPVRLPAPTHSRYFSHDPQRLEEGVKPWVSMAEALGWGMTGRPCMTVTGGGTATGGAEPFGNAARSGIERERESEVGGAW